MYLVRVFYQPDPQSSYKLEEEKIFESLQEAKAYSLEWHPCAYVVKIFEYGEGWFNI